jgi:hypothetical protein
MELSPQVAFVEHLRRTLMEQKALDAAALAASQEEVAVLADAAKGEAEARAAVDLALARCRGTFSA